MAYYTSLIGARLRELKASIVLSLGWAPIPDIYHQSGECSAFLRRHAAYQRATIITVLTFFWLSLLSLYGDLTIPIVPEALDVNIVRYVFYPITYMLLIGAIYSSKPERLVCIAWASIGIPVLVLASNPLLREIVVSALNSDSFDDTVTAAGNGWQSVSNAGVYLTAFSGGMTRGAAMFPANLQRLGETDAARVLQLYSTFMSYAANLAASYVLFQLLGLLNAAAPFHIVAWRLAPLLQHMGPKTYLAYWATRFVILLLIITQAFTQLDAASILNELFSTLDSSQITWLITYFIINYIIYGLVTWFVIEKMTGLVLLICYIRIRETSVQPQELEMSVSLSVV